MALAHWERRKRRAGCFGLRLNGDGSWSATKSSSGASSRAFRDLPSQWGLTESRLPADKGHVTGLKALAHIWMPENTRRDLSKTTQLYVLAVFGLGVAVIYISILELSLRALAWHLETWMRLAGLTLISGWLSVKLPSRRATISISETFVLAGACSMGLAWVRFSSPSMQPSCARRSSYLVEDFAVNRSPST